MPSATMLHARDNNDGCPSGYYNDGYGNCIQDGNTWDWWGRWVLLGAVILAILFLFLSCCCLARRRRRRGFQPMYGTRWMAPQTGKLGVQPQYEMPSQHQWTGQQTHGGQTGWTNPPPAYGGNQPLNQEYTGATFNPNAGYYGQQKPQSPEHVHQQNGFGGYQHPQNDGVYAPPAGPPPGKY